MRKDAFKSLGAVLAGLVAIITPLQRLIWGGEKGSPAYYRGTFTDDGVTVSGEWVYPGGGGCRSTMTKIKQAGRPDSGKHG